MELQSPSFSFLVLLLIGFANCQNHVYFRSGPGSVRGDEEFQPLATSFSKSSTFHKAELVGSYVSPDLEQEHPAPFGPQPQQYYQAQAQVPATAQTQQFHRELQPQEFQPQPQQFQPQQQQFQPQSQQFQPQSQQFQPQQQQFQPQPQQQQFQQHPQPHTQIQQFPAQTTMQQEFLRLFDFNQRPGQNPSSLAAQGQCPAEQPYLGDVAASCPRQEFFFGMNPKHMKAIGRLKEIMMTPSTTAAAICNAGELRDRPEINPNVWLNSLMSTVLNRRDLSAFQRPSLAEIMPTMFVNADVMNRARQMSMVPRGQRNQNCVVLDGSVGVDNGIENTLWYWREDIMLNSNHWYWHLLNPFMPTPVNGVTPPRPDRRGELFFYFHHCILARYNAERLANGLPKIIPLELKHGEVIHEPYYAHFDGTYTGQRWGDRPPNTRVQDILFNNIPDTPVNITLRSHNEFLHRINQAVQSGLLRRPDGRVVSLHNPAGIDLLAEVVEASVYSTNPGYYGQFGVHNEGHFFIGLAHDPNRGRRLPPGIMTDSTTAMRDPAFYAYHTPVAAIFHDHKDTLPPHHPTQGDFPLLWQGVSLTNFRVVSANRNPNDLTTFWNHATFDISRGLDFNRSAAQGQGPVYICARHLDHEPFSYEITIDKHANVRSHSASVRIFIAPKFDENGRPFPLSFQRWRFFPLDFFTVRLNPGRNFVTRRSVDTSLTIPWPQRLEELEIDMNLQTPNCGCGWPHHLLLPKGTPQGMIYDLFAMVTNGEDDAVPRVTGAPTTSCRSAPIFCGIPGQLYPDSKPMGYPFDRRPYSVNDPFTRVPRPVDNLEDFTRGIGNMGFTQIRITHLEGYNK